MLRLPLEGWLFLKSNMLGHCHCCFALIFYLLCKTKSFVSTHHWRRRVSCYWRVKIPFWFKALTLLGFLEAHLDGAPENSVRWACAAFPGLHIARETLFSQFCILSRTLFFCSFILLFLNVFPVPFGYKSHHLCIDRSPKITTPAFPDPSAKFPERPPYC